MTAEHPLARLREDIAAARSEAGRMLASFRNTAGLSQVQLAARIGYSATVVAHAERGRRPVSAEFWALADEAVGADGNLTAWGIRISDLTSARREEQRRLDKARHATRLSQLQLKPHADGAAPEAALASMAGTSASGRCPHCHRPVTL